jgi:hypothetical protein
VPYSPPPSPDSRRRSEAVPRPDSPRQVPRRRDTGCDESGGTVARPTFWAPAPGPSCAPCVTASVMQASQEGETAPRQSRAARQPTPAGLLPPPLDRDGASGASPPMPATAATLRSPLRLRRSAAGFRRTCQYPGIHGRDRAGKPYSRPHYHLESGSRRTGAAARSASWPKCCQIANLSVLQK